ncbi:GGDEF domain-containing protein, partial [Roseibium sp.]
AEAKHQADKVKELLANQVRSDPLTGLGNRRLLDEKLALLQDVKPLADGHALLYVDLDRFKEINDTYGHETGDLVLLHVAEALTGLVNADDTVVRLGGDEFVIVFGRARRERVLSASRAIVEQLSRPVNLDGATYTFGASVGVAFSHKPSELLRQADVALYSAKRRGRAQVAVYSSDLLDFRHVPIQSAAQPG